MKSVSPLKWVGSKNRLLPTIKRYLPTQPVRYYEPFMGGGALFFDYGHKAQEHAYLSDLCWPLMNTYAQLKSYCSDILIELRALQYEEYNILRGRFNYLKTSIEDGQMWSEDEQIELAARFIALNYLCFNGLYRENKKGRFNVPQGTDSDGNVRSLYDLDTGAIHRAADKLQNTCITYSSFHPWPWFTAPKPCNGDVVFYDPPYLKEFSSYNKDGFTADDHITLRNQALAHAENGATVVVCGSNNDASREIYGEPTQVVELSRTVGASNRGKAKEALWVWNSPQLSVDMIEECV